MSTRKVQIKLVAIADIHLKSGQEIDAEITVPSIGGGVCTTQIHESLLMMVAGSTTTIATGRAAAIAMGLIKE